MPIAASPSTGLMTSASCRSSASWTGATGQAAGPGRTGREVQSPEITEESISTPAPHFCPILQRTLAAYAAQEDPRCLQHSTPPRDGARHIRVEIKRSSRAAAALEEEGGDDLKATLVVDSLEEGGKISSFPTRILERRPWVEKTEVSSKMDPSTHLMTMNATSASSSSSPLAGENFPP